jgi:hypothetical protein
MRRLLPGCLLLLLARVALAAEPAVEVTVGGETRSFTRDALLAMPEATDITVPRDISYGVEMRYRAVPVASLFAGHTIPPDNVVEAVAADGFVAQLPLDLILNTDPAKPSLGLRSNPPISLGPTFPIRA